MKFRFGFTLIEILITIALMAVLASIVFVYLAGGRDKARDAKRKSDISQMGRYLSLACFIPQAGAGDYDLVDLASELIANYPQYQSFLSNIPRDPKSGNQSQSFYRYVVDEQNRCALYANLEYKQEPVTLQQLTAPTPGGGQGVLAAPQVGWNGTNLYFQFSN